MAANDPRTRVDIVDEATWNKVLAAGENPLPVPKSTDKGKYLKANDSTGKPEWAEGGSSGGGVLVVTDTDGTLDKTYAEILASTVPVFIHKAENDESNWQMVIEIYSDGVGYIVNTGTDEYTTDSASGYPVKGEPPK